MEVNITYNEDSLTGLRRLPDASVDCVITSPPYWGLRDYGVVGQLGQEPSPEDYINGLLNVFHEIYRVVKPKGVCYVNLGDTYGGSGAGTTKHADVNRYLKQSKQSYMLPNGKNIASTYRDTPLNKSLLLIPYRFALAMLARGWILRNIINWHKPNQMPSSVKDRFTVDFEPIFFFVKSKHYYFNQMFEPVHPSSVKRAQYGWNGQLMPCGHGAAGIKPTARTKLNPKGRNMRTTWSISTQGYKGPHFAVYPEKLVERMLLSGSPEGGIVLDPFMGSGTTAVVALKNNRQFIGFELNPDYIELQRQRLNAIVL